MVGPQQLHLAAQDLWGLVVVVVEDMDAAGVVEVVPVHLFGLQVLAVGLVLRFRVFHLNIIQAK